MLLSLFSFRPLEAEKQKNSDETTLEIDRRILRLKSRVWLINHSQFHKINIQGKQNSCINPKCSTLFYYNDEPP